MSGNSEIGPARSNDDLNFPNHLCISGLNRNYRFLADNIGFYRFSVIGPAGSNDEFNFQIVYFAYFSSSLLLLHIGRILSVRISSSANLRLGFKS